ncbi:MAG: porin [Holophagaceae bacterium]
MKPTFSRSILSTLALVSAFPLLAQPKMSGLLQVWQTQMLDNNLRWNSGFGKKYYNLRSEFTENTTSLRRAEFKMTGTIAPDVDWELMIDPAIASGSIVQDLTLSYKNIFSTGVELRAGQMKNYQSLEGLTSSSELMTIERSQLARVFGDNRDRGFALIKTFRVDDTDLTGRVVLGSFNAAGKSTDANAQKDFVYRLELNQGKFNKFGFYGLQGATDIKDTFTATTTPLAFGTSGPTAAAIYDNLDTTRNMGAFYQFMNSEYRFELEYMTGTLGRRFQAYGLASSAVKRDYLDQKFTGMVASLAYTIDGGHTFLARYDSLNYNEGNKYYGTTHPYLPSTGGDFSPKYQEMTVGYMYAFLPEASKKANLKINYIKRSDNFLAPRTGQTGAQGGDSIVVALQVAF